jgi:hypothetical protein
MKIFNKDNNGSDELVSVIGMISSGIDFSVWEPIIPLGIRELASIIGKESIDAASDYYNQTTAEVKPEMDEFLRLTQQAVAFFTWLKLIPTLDAQHDANGRNKKYGENEHGLTAVQEFKDESNILNLAYEATDALVECLENNKFDFWEKSTTKKAMDNLLIKNKSEFDTYYHIGSHRLFLILVPMIREVQESAIIPIIGEKYYDSLVQNEQLIVNRIKEEVCRPLALLTIRKAVQRLPIEVLPSGIVQVQQTGTVREKLKAEKEARVAVADSLKDDADLQLQQLQDIITDMDSTDDEKKDYYIGRPTVQSTGMTF